MRLLVIGGDAAGMTAATHVVRAVEGTEVVVVERGHYTSYSACGIPYFVGGEFDEADDLVARSPEEHRANGIVVHMRTEATAIDTAAKQVRVRDLDTGDERDEGYDALLYAAGAHPRAPLPELEDLGRFVHTLDEGAVLRGDLERAHGKAVSHVAVLGAGYIGLEVAEALVQRGIKTTVIERAPQVMTTLDADMAAHVLAALQSHGVAVRLGESVVGLDIVGDSCRAVVTDKGEVSAEVVVVALGSAPNVALAEAAGIPLGDSGAIAVDDRMRTRVDGVWAAGDCVESTHLLTGAKVNIQLGTHANKQGKVAGIDIAAVLGGDDGGEAEFPGVVGTAVTKLCAWEVGRTGLSEYEAKKAGIDYAATVFRGTAKSGYMPNPGTVYVKLLAEAGTGRVLGAQMVGTGNVAKRIDVAATWCHFGVTVQQAQLLDLSYAPPFGGTWDLLQVAARKLVKQLGLSPQL